MKSSALPTLVLLCSLSAATGATFIVTTTNDSGPGTLRQAMVAANANGGADAIQFAIPGNGLQTIALLTPLPEITNTLAINGYTQPGSNPNTAYVGSDAHILIRLDGVNLTSGIPSALHFRSASGSSVRGLILVRFGYGIQIYDSSNVTVAGNWIGMDVDGVARGMMFDGIAVSGPSFGAAMNNVIGGVTPADRNVISGNGEGISFFATTAANNFVLGNYIGTDPSGRLPRGNVFSAVSIQAATNIIIGNGSPGARNILSGCTGAGGAGVSILGGGGHRIQGNYIGTDASGFYDLGNFDDGIFAQGSSQLQILGNRIAHNRRNGVELFGTSSSVIEGNYIGTDAAAPGGFSLGNGQAGVIISGSTNRVGGPTPGAANTIHFNGGAGVVVNSGAHNEISGNSIFDNDGLAIDLGFTSGVTTNDVGDADIGENELQNFPVLVSATSAFGATRVQGVLNSIAQATFRLEFFASPAFDPTGNVEGELFLGRTNVTTDTQGDVSFTVMLPAATPTNYLVTATATDMAANTSEFSAGISVVHGASTPALTIASTGGDTATITWPSAAAFYQLEATTVLSPVAQWQLVSAPIVEVGAEKHFVVTNRSGLPRQFFRLRALKP